MTAPTLRPYLPADAEACADVRRAAIEVLAEEDYSDSQRAVWIDFTDDEALASRLAACLTLVVAGRQEGVVGFGSLKDNTHIEFLFTRPDFARQGVASLILDALEKLAVARGASAVTTNASDTALPLFQGRGYAAQRRITKEIDGEWLGTTVMEKKLTGATAPQGRA